MKYLIIGFSVVFLLLFFPTGKTTAAVTSIQIIGMTQQDLTNDGTPDLAIIDCHFSTTHDRIYVVDQGRDMRESNNWQEATDFNNDIWIYDIGADGSAQLIIVFTTENENQAAYIFVDENGNGNVGYELNGTHVNITESPTWRVKVVAQGSWLLRDGRINPDIKIFVDGMIDYFSTSQIPLAIEWADETIRTDGTIDWEVDIGDQNRDGQADYAVSCLLKDIPASYNAYPCYLITDQRSKDTILYNETIFWPLLISGTNTESKSGLDHPPVIMMDWENARIRRVGILGTTPKEGYVILSTAPTWQKRQVNEVRWENPIAYYDLADDQGDWPELMIRVFQPWKDIYPINNYPKDTLQIEYNWDQNNDNKLDYVEILCGRKTIKEVTDFPDFSLLTVPYELLPKWTTSQNWDLVAFVVGESGGKLTNDSLWVWNELSELQDNYLAGTSNTPPLEIFQDIAEGYRGEYIIDPNSQARLYYSPVDQRLHQWQTQAGVWNLGEDRRIRYQNLDGDAYIDQWQYWIGNTLVQQMNQSPGSLVVSGLFQVKIKMTNAPYSLFKTQPPGNHDEWVKLGEQLNANQSDLAGNDFTGMLEQLPGELLSIGSASLRDYRPTETGYRFVLGLEPGYRFEGPDWLGLAKLEPGEYAVSYEDGKFRLLPLTPAQVTASVEIDASETPTQFGNEKVRVSLSNQGLEDAKQVLVRLGTYNAGGEISYTEPQTVTVNAGENTLVSFDWAPKEAGAWQLQAQASIVDPQSNNGQSVSAMQHVLVQPAEGSSMQDEVSGFGVVALWQVVLLISSVVLTTGLSGWALMRSVGQGEMNAEQDPNKVDRNKT
jgi:hypothetical protein